MIDTTNLREARKRRLVLRDAMDVLEQMVSRPESAEGWHETVDGALDDLGEALDEHIDTVEGDAGLLVEILDHAPRLAVDARLIEAEHRMLADAWQRAKEAVGLSMANADPGQVRRRVISLLGRLTLHRQHGADLVYEAYDVDISAGD